jgi:hypothetical protein
LDGVDPFVHFDLNDEKKPLPLNKDGKRKLAFTTPPLTTVSPVTK